MNYSGFFINLDRSIERRALLEAGLTRCGLAERYRRIPAVAGNPQNLRTSLKNSGEVGCFLSHVAALQAGRDLGQNLHIIEDDAIFARSAGPTLDAIIASGTLDAYDIVYTDIALPLSNISYRLWKNRYDKAVKRDAAGRLESVGYDIFDLRDEDYTAACSYLVNHASVQKLAALYETEIADGLRVAVDDFLKLQAKVGAIRAGCLFPFVTSVRVEDTLTSTVRIKPDTSRKFTAANIGRYSFFIDCDWAEAERLMQKHILLPDGNDRHVQLLAQLLGFSLRFEDNTTA